MEDSKIYPFSYRAFGLNIRSQFPITGFYPTNIESADVWIYEDFVPKALGKVINRSVLYESNENEFLFRIENVASYYIRNGSEIVVQRNGQASQAEVSAFITGTSFGFLMHQRRLLPLHACTVIFHDKCLVFAGISGAGKSTLAMALVKAGGNLIADDISVIDFRDQKPIVCPAFPVIKIWEDSLKHLGLSPSGLEPVRGELKKYYQPVASFSDSHPFIDQVFILQTHNRPETVTKSIHGIEKFNVLKKHTYLFRGIPKTGLERNHFVLVHKLAVQVPVTLLTRSNGEMNTEKLVHAILEIL
jgi:hypothetical protein